MCKDALRPPAPLQPHELNWDAEEYGDLLKQWVEPDLLVLDDLFMARRISEHAAEVLLAILHQR